MNNVRYLFPLENIEGNAEAGTADRGRIGDIDADQAGIPQVDLLAHEAVIVGADHRHVFEVRGLVGIDDRFINAPSPDPIYLLAGADQDFHFLRALVKRPAGKDRCDDLAIGILLERLAEALLPVSTAAHASPPPSL